LAHVDCVADRSDTASTRDPCARACTAADATSGRLLTGTGFAAATAFGAATAATAFGVAAEALGAGSVAVPNTTHKATTAAIAVGRTPPDF
jgi:hypothetical protein